MSTFDAEIATAPIIYLAIESILFFVLLLVIEKLMKVESVMRCCSKSEADVEETQPINEEDVRN